MTARVQVLIGLVKFAMDPSVEPRMPEQIQHPRLRFIGIGGIFQFESLAPNHNGSPDQLIHGDDHHDHRENRGDHGGGVTLIDRLIHVRSDAGETVIFVAEREGFVDGQKEPAPGHRHHGVPDEADHGGRKFE